MAEATPTRLRSARVKLQQRAHLVAQRMGVDFFRFPEADSDFRAFRMFTACRPDVILDVGANSGQFATQCRSFGYRAAIVSFEPGSEAFARLSAAASHDPLWSVQRMGLGDRPGELTLHVAANAGASSSLLPMLPAHELAAPHALFVSDEKVPVRRLDEWWASRDRNWDRVALKIDTQGFERHVLAGAGSLLDTLVGSIQLEMSLVPLYQGSWLWDEAAIWLKARGYALAGITSCLSEPGTGRLLQFDGVFVRG